MNKQILLHVCCGPCSLMPILRLRDMGYTVTAWFMNPNIHPLAEYLRRRDAMAECATRLDVPVIYDDASWHIQTWLRDVANHIASPPARCAYCCSTRLEACAAKAKQLGFAAFSSSLLYSRYQPHDLIRQKGEQLAARHGNPAFVYQDFRQDWQAGIDLSKSWGIYRQPYCGCVYSEAERYAKKLHRLIAAEKNAAF